MEALRNRTLRLIANANKNGEVSTIEVMEFLNSRYVIERWRQPNYVLSKKFNLVR